jgi:uncharacterized protein YndB with AHSA1/START domain
MKGDSMTPKPTGRLRGSDLVLTRSFRAPIEDVWTSITHPESSARWFGPWERSPGDGRRIRVQMTFEKGTPWIDATIESCEEPRHLVVTTKDEHGAWRLEITLAQTGDTTKLELVHHLEDTSGIGEVGPGWEYYLDMLVAARAGQPLPSFDDYYPSQKVYFVALVDTP